MANGFSIAITATDNASKIIGNVNKNLMIMQAPFKKLGGQISTFTKLSGLDNVGKGFASIGKTAMNAAQGVARIIEPLAAITGIASVAGMVRLSQTWAVFGSQLGFTAQRIGVAAGDLQTLQGAAVLAGASAGSMTSGLQNLGQTMYDAIGGRAPEATALFNQLGIAFDDGTRHARKVTDVLPEVADKIAGIKDPFTQARVATALFGGAAEDLLPFLRKGSAGIKEYTDKARSYGVFSQGAIDASNKLRESFSSVSLAVTGLTNSIAEKLAPIVGPLLDQMADWIGKNREFIATQIGQYVGEFADFVKSIDFHQVVTQVTDLIKGANNLAQDFGGWKTALEAIVAIKIASWALPVAANLFTVGRAVAGLLSAFPLLNAALAAAGATYLAYIRTKEAYDEYQQRSADNKAALDSTQSASAPQARFDARGAARTLPPDLQAHYDETHRNARSGGTGAFFPGTNKTGRGPSDLSQYRGAPALPTLGPGGATTNALGYFQSGAGGGWTKAQAAGLASNIQTESGFNPFAKGDSGHAFGLGQWHEDRQAEYAKLFGHTMQSVKSKDDALKEQLSFYNYELTKGNEQGAGKKLRGASSAYEAGAIVSKYDERPRDRDLNQQIRGDLANRIYAEAPAPAPSVAMPNTAAEPAHKGKVEVAINVRSAPGTSAKTTASSTGPAIAGPAKIDSAMAMA